MAEKQCTVSSCDRPLRSRGYCNLHYQRWRQHGDPFVNMHDRYNGMVCNVDGCAGSILARGWCSIHYDRWRHHGTTDSHKGVNQNTHKVFCIRKHRLSGANIRVNDRGSRICIACQNDYAADYYRKNRSVIQARSAEHRRANRGLYLDYGRRRRARVKKVFVENVSKTEVYRRDKGICGICLQPVSVGRFDIDHIVPIVLGGLECYDNVQVAHPTCNKKKGVKVAVGTTLPLRLEA